MPKGIAFLNVKAWHPSNKRNMEKIWKAEMEYDHKKKSEAEHQQRLNRELDSYRYDQMAQGKTGASVMADLASDSAKKGSGELAFMYARPSGLKQAAEEGEQDDEAVREFKRALAKRKRDPNFSMHAKTTELEKIAGKRKRDELTIEEQEERFPFLKNAPLEGAYARDLKVNFKPFNKEVRNVKCLRCGTWGHVSGDRECPLKDCNPLDAERQRREDPMSYMEKDDVIADKQKLVLKSGALPREMAVNTSEGQNRVVLEEGIAFGEDVDEEFLASLSTSQKKQLLKKLKKMEGLGGEEEGAEKGKKEHRHHKDKKKDKKKKDKKKKKEKKRKKESHRSDSSDSESS